MSRTIQVAICAMALFVFAGPASGQSVLNTPASQGLDSEPSGTTDHELVVNAWGFQVISQQLDPKVNLNIIGVRHWVSESIGVDFGGGILVNIPNGNGAVQAGGAFMVGVPLAIRDYKHLTLYFEPKVDFGIWRAAKGSAPWRLDLGGYAGMEVSLGWIGIPRLAFLADLGVALTVVNDGNQFATRFGTRTGKTFPWMFSGSVGVIYYY